MREGKPLAGAPRGMDEWRRPRVEQSKRPGRPESRFGRLPHRDRQRFGRSPGCPRRRATAASATNSASILAPKGARSLPGSTASIHGSMDVPLPIARSSRRYVSPLRGGGGGRGGGGCMASQVPGKPGKAIPLPWRRDRHDREPRIVVERPRLTSTSSTPPSPDPSTPIRDAISIRFERRVAPSRPPSTSFQLLPMAGQLDATVAAGNCQCDRHKQGPPCSCVRPLLILWGSFTSMALLRGGADGDSATRNLRVARPPCARRLLD